MFDLKWEILSVYYSQLNDAINVKCDRNILINWKKKICNELHINNTGWHQISSVKTMVVNYNYTFYFTKSKYGNTCTVSRLGGGDVFKIKVVYDFLMHKWKLCKRKYAYVSL